MGPIKRLAVFSDYTSIVRLYGDYIIRTQFVKDESGLEQTSDAGGKREARASEDVGCTSWQNAEVK